MGKICYNCGAPHRDNLKSECVFCGNILEQKNEIVNFEVGFLLIQYEFIQRNYRMVVQLSDEYLKKDKKNIPLWTYKIISEAYIGGFGGAISNIFNSLKTIFDFGIFNIDNRSAIQYILQKEIDEKITLFVSNNAHKTEALDSISSISKYLSDEFLSFKKL